MKETSKLRYQKEKIRILTELLQTLLDESDNNLDQFVDGDILVVSKSESEKFKSSVSKFINTLKEIFQKTRDTDFILETVKKVCEQGSNTLFYGWLEHFVSLMMQPYEETAFLREMDDEKFALTTEFCFSHFILQDDGDIDIENMPIDDENQLFIFKKALLTFVDMVVGRNYSKEKVSYNIQEMFDLKDTQFEIWWEAVNKNRDVLWKIVVMRRFTRIEQKLEQIIGILED